LDAIYAYGVTQLFSELAFEIGVAFGLIGKTSRMDTTSLVVYGDYEQSDDSAGFHITHGYSKDGRPDLKQVVLNLATTGKANLPIWMSAHSGNASDKVILQKAAERMKQFASALKEAPAFLFVGDSALYERCLERAGDMLWLSRVPHSHSKAKEYLGLDQEIDWTELDDPNYRISQAFRHSYKGVSQRWVMVFSEHAYQRECITLEKKIAQEQEAMSKKLWHLGNTPFACEQDALKALKPLVKQLKYHTVSHHLKAVHHYNGKGRPKKDSKPEVVQFHLVATLSQDTAAIAQQRLTKGRFILATNQLDETLLANADMLYEYKQQTHTEAGFRFIKGLRCREFS
jgi:transposase